MGILKKNIMKMTEPQAGWLRGDLRLSEETLEKIDKDEASKVINDIVKIKRTYNDYPPATKSDNIRSALHKFRIEVTKKYNPLELVCPDCKGSKIYDENLKPCYC